MRRRAALGADILADPAFAESAELSKPTFDRGRRGDPGGDDRHARAAHPLHRARRRRAGAARDRADLPVDRRAAERRLPDARLDRRPRDRLPRAGGGAGRRDRLRRPDRDRRPRPRRGRRLPQRARRQQSRADGARRHRRRWAARRAADARSAHRSACSPTTAAGWPVAADCARSASSRWPLRSTPRCETSPADCSTSPPPAAAREPAQEVPTPGNVADLMTTLTSTPHGVAVQRVRAGRYIAYLPGPNGVGSGRLRLVVRRPLGVRRPGGPGDRATRSTATPEPG